MSDTSYPPEAEEARERLLSLSPVVYAALEHGIECGRDFFDGSLDPWLFPHIVRYRVCAYLEDRAVDFQMSRNPMSGIEIRCEGYELRIFKKCGMDVDSYLYPPGRSLGRQEFYGNPAIPGTEAWILPPRKLAYVWEAMPDHLELSLVCPDGYDGIWRPGKSRWVIPIPHPALAMDPEVDFASSEDQEDDLPITLDEASSDPDPDDAV